MATLMPRTRPAASQRSTPSSARWCARDGDGLGGPAIGTGRGALASGMAASKARLKNSANLTDFLPSPLGGEGLGVRGSDLGRDSPLTPGPSPPRGEGGLFVAVANAPVRAL